MFLKMLMCFCLALESFVMPYNSIIDSFDNSDKIVVYSQGDTHVLQSNNTQYVQIINALKDITLEAHDMPAYGVSIDELTRKEQQTGLWLELQFYKTQYYNEMPFDALLIKIEKDHSGFNLIRKYNDKYEGRCFYLNLKGTMEKLCWVVNNILDEI